MMRVFGGWEAYRTAPRTVVQEQRLVWLADVKATNEQRQQEADALK